MPRKSDGPKPHRWAVTVTVTSSYPEPVPYSAVGEAAQPHVAIGAAIKRALMKRKASPNSKKRLVNLLIHASRLTSADVP